MTFAATVLTLSPEMFPGPLGVSLAGRALDEGTWSCETVQIRDFTADKHRTVDDTPAGGGAGMVLKVDVLARALDSVADSRPILAMTPRGRPITQARIREIAAGPSAFSRPIRGSNRSAWPTSFSRAESQPRWPYSTLAFAFCRG